MKNAVPLFYQVEAVRESAARAGSAVVDAKMVWSEGDWRTQQTVKRAEHLEAAFETLKALHDSEQRTKAELVRNEQQASKT